MIVSPAKWFQHFCLTDFAKPILSVEQPILAAVVKVYDHGSEEGSAGDFEKAANTMSSGD